MCNVVSAYAPHHKLVEMIWKKDFYNTLEDTMLPDQEHTFLCGELDGHIGDWRQEIDCKIGRLSFGNQSLEGQRILIFCHSQNLADLNFLKNAAIDRRRETVSKICNGE